MFQTGGPQTGNQFTTSSILQQNNSLLGNPQFQNTNTSVGADTSAFNSTAPQSSGNPAVASMVKALKGGM